MNREIKFRAWSPELKCMSGKVNPLKGETFVFQSETAMRFGLASEDVLMQYTGLKDRDGKEIYEGDIVMFDTCSRKQVTRPVEWCAAGCWRPFNDTEFIADEQGDWFKRPRGGGSPFKIIGDIFTTPELLK